MTYNMLLPSATTAMDQALLTRAFFIQRSQGPFNALFTGELVGFFSFLAPRSFSLFFFRGSLLSFSPSLSLALTLSLSLFLFFPETSDNERTKKNAGNGYTATGVGAVFAGESTEFLFSPFFSKSLPPKARATLQFCLNGVNGGVPINGNCKTLTPPAP